MGYFGGQGRATPALRAKAHQVPSSRSRHPSGRATSALGGYWRHLPAEDRLPAPDQPALDLRHRVSRFSTGLSFPLVKPLAAADRRRPRPRRPPRCPDACRHRRSALRPVAARHRHDRRHRHGVVQRRSGRGGDALVGQIRPARCASPPPRAARQRVRRAWRAGAGWHPRRRRPQRRNAEAPDGPAAALHYEGFDTPSSGCPACAPLQGAPA